MKRCPSCQRTYDDEQIFCSLDATPLVSESASEISSNETEETMVAGTTAATPQQTPQPGNVASVQEASLADEPPATYQPPPQAQPQMSPPSSPQQQQWATPPPSGRINPNVVLLGVVGLLVAVGVGLAVYLGARPSSPTSLQGKSTVTQPSSSSSANYNRFVGMWRDEGRPNHTGVRFTEDGKIMDPVPGGGEEHEGNYSVSGDKAIITPLRGEDTATATIEADGRMRVEVRGRTFYMVRK